VEGSGTVEFRVLGPLQVRVDNRPAPLGGAKQRLTLAALLLHANAVVSADRLADILWGDFPPDSALSTLQKYVYRLRRAIEPGRGSGAPAARLLTEAPGYRLRVEPDQLDSGRFKRLLSDAQRLAGRGDLENATAGLDEALGLWRGPAWAEFADHEVARAEIAQLEDLHVLAIEDRAEIGLVVGRHAELIGELERVTTDHPLRERPHAQLMLALYRSGRQAEALRTYQRLRERLVEELGIEPGAVLSGLEDAVLQQKPELDWTPDRGALPGATVARITQRPAADRTEQKETADLAGMPSGVVSFLLTDIVGSTDLWDRHSGPMADALVRHDALIGEVVSSSGGMVCKSKGEGDATVSVFARATEAVVAAGTLQQRLGAEPWPGGLELRVRASVHTGEAHERDGDYFGSALNRAARLRGLADGGQVLLSSTTASVVADKLPDHTQLVDLGPRQLRGLSRPERVFKAVFASPDADAPPRSTSDVPVAADPELVSGERSSTTRRVVPQPKWDLPSALRRTGEAAFVGRRAEFRYLEELWRKTARGRSGTALVAGEPGIGKTTLVGELARVAHSQGATVLYGRCDEDLGVPYQPFVEALGFYSGNCPFETLAEQVAPYGPELARMLPQLRERLIGLPDPVRTDSETERYHLFEGVRSLLTNAAVMAPVVLVLDDLHWAAKPTLLLLRHLARPEQPGSFLLLGTYRDTEVDRDHPLSNTLADLRREPQVGRVALEGMSEGEVVELLAALSGSDLDDEAMKLARRVQAETEGNPFFLGQLLRALAEAESEPGAGDGLHRRTPPVERVSTPPAVRETINQRLAHLDRDTNEVLTLAAVIGREFDTPLLLASSPLGEETVLDRLEVGEQSRLIAAIPDQPGRYSFAHALIRSTIYEEIPTAARARIHRRLGRALEAAGVESRLEELAHHYCEAAALGEVHKALEYGRRAGDQALARLAYEEAAQWYERVVQLLEGSRLENNAQRCELWLALGGALTAAGSWPEARDSYHQAADIAAASNDGARLAAAALGYGSSWQGLPEADPVLEGLLDKALKILGPGEPSIHCQLLARLASARFNAGKEADALVLSEEALGLAPRLDDPLSESACLHVRHVVMWEPTEAVGRLEIADAIIGLGARAGSIEREQVGRWDRIVDLLQLGRVTEAARTTSLYREVAAGAGRPFDRWWGTAFDATIAGATGRLEEAEQLSTEALTIGSTLDPEGSSLVYAVQIYALRWAQGRLAEIEPQVMALAHDRPSLPYISGGLAALYAETGDTRAARQQIARCLGPALADLTRDWQWLATVTLVAHAASLIGLSGEAECLYALLQPYSGTQVLFGPGLAAVGPVDRWLGHLACLGGDRQMAMSHFKDARQLTERWEVHTWEPIVSLEQSLLLNPMGSADAQSAAASAAVTALAKADSLGLNHVSKRAKSILRRFS
jgi:DNA-binding SARP family transcriptional activator/cytochrome c-type biogenesis protein CcmH/NrfG